MLNRARGVADLRAMHTAVELAAAIGTEVILEVQADLVGVVVDAVVVGDEGEAKATIAVPIQSNGETKPYLATPWRKQQLPRKKMQSVSFSMVAGT